MGTDIAALNIRIDTLEAKLASKDLDNLAKSGENAEKSVFSLTNAAKALASAFAGYKMAQFADEAVRASARYDTMGVVLTTVGRNAGYNATQMRQFSEGVRASGISMVESREIVTRMAQAQLDLTKSTQLARVAQDAAVIGNVNSTEAFSRMVQGIQSGQTEILRTLGLNVSFEQSYTRMAISLHKSVGSLSEQEKAQARMNAVLEYGSRIAGTYEAAMGTAGKQITSFKRYIDDFKVSVGAGAQDALTSFVGTLTTTMKRLKEFTDSESGSNTVKAIADAIGSIGTSMAHSVVPAFEVFIVSLGKVAKWWETLPPGLQKFLVGAGAGGLVAGIPGAIVGAAASQARDNDYGTSAWAGRQLARQQEDLRTGAYIPSIREQLAHPDLDAATRKADLEKEINFSLNLYLRLKAEEEKAAQEAQDAQDRRARLAHVSRPTEAETFAVEERLRKKRKAEERALKEGPHRLAAQAAALGSENALSSFQAERGGNQLNIELTKLNAEYEQKMAAHQGKLADINTPDSVKGAIRKQMEAEYELYSKKYDLAVKMVPLQDAVTQAQLDLNIAENQGKDTYQLQVDLLQKKLALSQADQVNSVQGKNAQALAASEELKLADARTLAARNNRVELAGLTHDSQASLAAQREIVQAELDKVPPLERQLLLKKKLADLDAHARGDGFYAAKDALASYSDSALDHFQNMQTAAGNFAKNTEDALVNMATGGKNAFSNFVKGVESDLLRLSIRENITGPLFKAISNGSAWSGLTKMFGFNHGGGMVGDPTFMRSLSPFVFAGAPRFHGGGWPGLAPDEVPIIAQKGERVLSKDEVAAGAGTSGPITVKLVNQSGQQLKASTAKVTQDSQGTLVEVILDAAARDVGGFRTGMQAALGVR